MLAVANFPDRGERPWHAGEMQAAAPGGTIVFIVALRT
jgi:hypothetical protein